MTRSVLGAPRVAVGSRLAGRTDSTVPQREPALLAHRPGRLQLTLDDGGTGLDSDTRPRASHPFFTTKPERVGLGLCPARAVLERYGRRLQFANRPEGGARAKITTTTAEGGLR